jgi:hypothetical protein
MSTKNYPRSTTDLRRRDAFDELAIGLSRESISRGRALKLTGAALLGGALSIFALADGAEAKKSKKSKMALCREDCEGCCNPFGHCYGGNSNNYCGYNGHACGRCAEGYHCDSLDNKRLGGVCQPIGGH